jgi:hypothetical protein
MRSDARAFATERVLRPNDCFDAHPGVLPGATIRRFHPPDQADVFVSRRLTLFLAEEDRTRNMESIAEPRGRGPIGVYWKESVIPGSRCQVPQRCCSDLVGHFRSSLTYFGVSAGYRA